MSAEHGGSSNGDVDTSSERSWWCGTPDNQSPVATFLHETTQEPEQQPEEENFPQPRPRGLTGLDFRETVDSTEAVLSLLLEGWPTGTGGVVNLPSGLWTTVGRLVRELIRRVNFLEEQLEKSQLEWQAAYQDKVLAQKQLQMHISKSSEAMKYATSQKAALQDEVVRLGAALESAQAAAEVQQARLEAAETALHTLQLQKLRPSQRKKAQQQSNPSEQTINGKLQKSLQHEREVNKKLQQQRKGLVSAHRHGHSMEQLSVQLKVQKEETHTVLMLNNALETEVRQLKKRLATVQSSSISSLSTSSLTTQDTSIKDQLNKSARLTKVAAKAQTSTKVNKSPATPTSHGATATTNTLKSTKISSRPSTAGSHPAASTPNSSAGSGQAHPTTPSGQQSRHRAAASSTPAHSPTAPASTGSKAVSSRHVNQGRGKQAAGMGAPAIAQDKSKGQEASMMSIGSADSAPQQPTTPDPIGGQDPAPASSEPTNSSSSSTLLDFSSSQDHSASFTSAETSTSHSPRVVRTPKAGTLTASTPKAATPTGAVAARRTAGARVARSPVVFNPRSTQLSQGQKPAKPQPPKWIP